MKKSIATLAIASALITLVITVNAYAKENFTPVDNKVIEIQRATLANNTHKNGYGPQSPRDLSEKEGDNPRIFGLAPDYTEMNLCNIHMHKNAEHKGGEFTKYAGNGDGTGYQTGFAYTGTLTSKEMQPTSNAICPSPHGGLKPGDTIELHYVHSTAQVQPGSTLGSCLGKSTVNPQLRVESQVFVLVNDDDALDFEELTEHSIEDDKYQAINLLNDTGTPIKYTGSTTGPSYNEQGSPFQVTWSVRPKVAKVDIESVGEWCEDNVYEEDHAHGVRNLVVNPDLLSEIK
ncbi:delta-class carbonic anhydrase [Colwellia echini]|uniref:Cadmium carbonic anhydrase n=1 Tax=Colwellia echini TaxID=1982103 RepID=A0ABY3MZA5_9GAMM|nr:delta-class carbonic anhydrase [Colwellia echini]TYK66560.1 hypothetical protein CWS31_004260 [Colwellia echini]